MNDEVRIPLFEEEISVEKRRYETGKVRVSTFVSIEPFVVREELTQQTTDVKRVPMDIEIEHEPVVREEDGVLIVPVVEERVVVTKRLVLVEELHIKTTQTTEHIEIPVTRRVMRAVVERDEAGNNSSNNQRGTDGEF